MAAPAYIKERVTDGLIEKVHLVKFSDGYSCEFRYINKDKKALIPSTGKQATRVWLTYGDVMKYVQETIGWTGPIFDHNYNQVQ